MSFEGLSKLFVCYKTVQTVFALNGPPRTKKIYEPNELIHIHEEEAHVFYLNSAQKIAFCRRAILFSTLDCMILGENPDDYFKQSFSMKLDCLWRPTVAAGQINSLLLSGGVKAHTRPGGSVIYFTVQGISSIWGNFYFVSRSSLSPIFWICM